MAELETVQPLPKRSFDELIIVHLITCFLLPAFVSWIFPFILFATEFCSDSMAKDIWIGTAISMNIGLAFYLFFRTRIYEGPGDEYLNPTVTLPRGRWLGIDRVQGAYVRRAIVALLFAAPLLFMAACVACSLTGQFLVRLLVLTRARLSDAFNPYRTKIRTARRAIAVLRREKAEAALIAKAEQTLAVWRARHAHEKAERAAMDKGARRKARIDAAHDDILRLESEADAEGCDPTRKRAALPRASTSS